MTRRSFTPITERAANKLGRIHLLTNREFNCLDILEQYDGRPAQSHEIARAMRLTAPTAKRFLWQAGQVGIVQRTVIDEVHVVSGIHTNIALVSGYTATPLGRELFASALHEIDRRIEGAA